MPEKRDPYGENPGLENGYAWCDECQGDGGGEYNCKGFSPYLDGPDYEWVECSMCEGTGQLPTMEKALALDRQKIDALEGYPPASANFTCDLDEEIPF